jgi:hypothetical protein
MEFKFLTQDDLLMGSRDQELTVDGSTIHVTQLEVYSMEPEPVVYEVRHTAWIEIADAPKMIVGYSSSLWTDIDQAREEFKRVHLDPPTSIPDGVEF